MTIPDPHRVLVDDLHAEIRRLRAELDRVEAELRQALWHLNPTLGENDGHPQGSTSSETGLSRSETAANVGQVGVSPSEPQTATQRLTVPALPDVGPVTIVPGITVSPSIIRQRTQPARDEGCAGDLDDEI